MGIIAQHSILQVTYMQIPTYAINIEKYFTLNLRKEPNFLKFYTTIVHPNFIIKIF